MFIRVKDRRTKHQYDVHVQAFDESKHEEIKRVPRSKRARPAKPYIQTKRAVKPEQSSTVEVVEGVSPAGD